MGEKFVIDFEVSKNKSCFLLGAGGSLCILAAMLPHAVPKLVLVIGVIFTVCAILDLVVSGIITRISEADETELRRENIEVIEIIEESIEQGNVKRLADSIETYRCLITELLMRRLEVGYLIKLSTREIALMGFVMIYSDGMMTDENFEFMKSLKDEFRSLVHCLY